MDDATLMRPIGTEFQPLIDVLRAADARLRKALDAAGPRRALSGRTGP